MASDLDAGTVLLKRYRLDRLIGQGGMGAVWAGYDTKLHREVAIKLMSERIASSDTALKRFEREAMAVARLRSQHIAQVYDYGVHEGSPFMVMELLAGRDLKDFLARHSRLSLMGTCRIVVQIAKALHTAHKAGIVHRDLKPANVFLAQEGEEEVCKVFDFGVAKAMTNLGDHDQDTTAEGVLLGTPRYMAPEQALGAREVDRRADLWSLGVVAYQCLTGTVPFVAPGTGHVLVKICTEPHPLASGLIEDPIEGIDTFFERALAKKPDDRFDNARQLAAALVTLADQSLSHFSIDDTADSSALVAIATRAANGVGDDGISDISEVSAKPLLPAAASARDSAPFSNEGGTLGPATHTAGMVKARPARVGLLALVVVALLVVGGVYLLGRSAGDDSAANAAAASAALAPEGSSAPSRPIVAASIPIPPVAAVVSTIGSSAAGASASASKPTTSPTRPRQPPVATAPATAMPSVAAPPPPAPSSKPEPSSKPTGKGDGLDLFNKRW